MSEQICMPRINNDFVSVSYISICLARFTSIIALKLIEFHSLNIFQSTLCSNLVMTTGTAAAHL